MISKSILYFILLVAILFVNYSCSVKTAQLATHNPNENEAEFSIPNIPASKNIEGLYSMDELDEKPRYPGCEDTFSTIEEKDKCANRKFLMDFYKSLKYPPEARHSGTSGLVIAQFIIEPSGYISNAEILQDIGKGCGNAVILSINKMNSMPNRWIPGKLNGEKVRVLYILPVKFNVH